MHNVALRCRRDHAPSGARISTESLADPANSNTTVPSAHLHFALTLVDRSASWSRLTSVTRVGEPVEVTEPERTPRARPTLGAIASLFARYANTTFGGGSATIAVLKDQLVDRRAWIDQPEFELGYALSRLTPGTNLLAFCTAAGWLTRRWLGAVVSLLAASIPCSILAVVMTVFFEQLHGSAVFRAALGGALAAAVAIMVSTAWVFAEPHVKAAPWKAVIVMPCVVVLAVYVTLSPVKILLLAAATGLVWPIRRVVPGEAESR